VSDDRGPPSLGAIRALIALGAFAALGLIGLVVFVATQPEARRLLSVGRDLVEGSLAGVSAPGAEELRGAGCEQAIVWTLGEFVEAAGGLLPEGGAWLLEDPERASTPLVLCELPPLHRGVPDCDAVALLYAEAVSPAVDFLVQVRGYEHFRKETLCAAFYSPVGELVAHVGPRLEPIPLDPETPVTGVR
jgi:hypothetical protein